jgi:hypothetical protein
MCDGGERIIQGVGGVKMRSSKTLVRVGGAPSQLFAGTSLSGCETETPQDVGIENDSGAAEGLQSFPRGRYLAAESGK